jgi:hypothetical protein
MDRLRRCLGIAALFALLPAPVLATERSEVLGWWKITLEADGQKAAAFLQLDVDLEQDRLTGFWRTRRADTPIHDVKLEEGKLSFHFFLESPEGKQRMTFGGSLIEGRLLGSLTSPRSAHSVVGVRDIEAAKPSD